MPDEPVPPRVQAFVAAANTNTRTYPVGADWELVLSSDKNWQEQLNNVGSGSLTLPTLVPIESGLTAWTGAYPRQLPYDHIGTGTVFTAGSMQTGRDWLTIGGSGLSSLFQCYVPGGLYNIHFLVDGITAFAMRVEQVTGTYVSGGEEAEMVTVLKGRSILSEWEDAVVYPYDFTNRWVTHPGKFPWSDTRVFSIHSPEFDDSLWSDAPVTITTQDEVAGLLPSPWAGGYPSGWPDPYAWWEWDAMPDGSGDNPDGDVYFRLHFTPPVANQVYAVFIAVDNSAEILIDGEPVTTISGGDGEAREGWTHTTRFDFLDAGSTPRIISIKGTNVPLPGPGVNPGGLIFTIFRVPAVGSPDVGDPSLSWLSGGNFITHSGGSIETRVLPRPTTVPGFTPGQVIRILMEEAQARNGQGFDCNSVLNGWTLGFTDTTDSRGDPWNTDLAQTEISFQIGQDYLSCLLQLVETQIDITCSVVGKVLYAWNKPSSPESPYADGVYGGIGSLGVDTGLFLDYPDAGTVPMIDATVDFQFSSPDHYLLKTREGYRESPVVNGFKEAYIELGDIDRNAASKIIAKLRARGSYVWPSITATIEPTDVTQTPYHSYNVGDRMTVRTPEGDAIMSKLVGLSVQEDAQGDPIFTTEFITIYQDNEARLQRWIKRMSNGASGGRSEVASPVTVIGQVQPRDLLDESSPPFSHPGEVTDTDDGSPPWTAPLRGVITSFSLRCLLGGTGDTTVDLLVEGAVISTLTLAAGDTDTRDYGINHLVERGQRVWVQITAAGNCWNLTMNPVFTTL